MIKDRVVCDLAGELGQAFRVRVAVAERHVDGARGKRLVLDLVDDQMPLAGYAAVSPGLDVRLLHGYGLQWISSGVAHRERQHRHGHCRYGNHY